MKINKTDTYTQVTFSGRLDAAVAKNIPNDALQLIEEENHHVIIDFSGLDYISSSGLRFLLILQKRAVAKQVKLSICNLESNIRDIFTISGFSGIFRIYPDLETAIINP